MSGGVLGVSYSRIADEFGTTKGKVRHLLEKMAEDGFLPSGIRSDAAPSILSSVKPAVSSAPTTQERMKEFYDSLIPYVEKYGKKVVREFYDYWSETNPSGKKMRFEMQKTWDIERRLSRWAGKENVPADKLHTDGTILHAGQMDYEKDGW